MDETWLARAIWNNAIWCDTVCRTHGRPGEFLDGAWICRHAAPPLYPNVITLTRGAEVEQLARVQELVDGGLGGDWGVKDSFASLDLTANGFRILFNAEWIYLPVGDIRLERDIHGVRWSQVTEEAELYEWEMAWRGLSLDETDAHHGRLFLSQLLSDQKIAFIAAYQGRQIAAGAIGYSTDHVVGISNMFVVGPERPPYQAGCVSKLREAFPVRPIVGYESAGPLEELQAIGFRRIGPLRIWARSAQKSWLWRAGAPEKRSLSG